MKYYAVIDTNVLVSAMLKHHSVPGSIIDLAFDGPIIPVLNDAIEKEYREVLSRPKFHLPSDLIDDILSSFHQRGLYIDAEELDMEFRCISICNDTFANVNERFYVCNTAPIP